MVNKYTIGSFIDLSKAFGSVDHIILVGKLEMHGVSDRNLQWFESHLSHRKQ